MMEILLAAARKAGAEAEVYALSSRSTAVSFENARLKDIEASIQSGLGLRLIKGGKLGLAYACNPPAPEELLKRALASIEAGGAEAPPAFSRPGAAALAGSYDPAIETLSTEQVADELAGICSRLGAVRDGQVNVSARFGTQEIRIVNSRGLDCAQKLSSYLVHPKLTFPGTYASINRALRAEGFARFPDETIEHLKGLFASAGRQARPRSGRMKALFLPEAMKVLYWRLEYGINAKNVFQKESRLLGRVGEKVFSDQLTFVDAPGQRAGSRIFDDEGRPCRDTVLIERGVLKSYYSDLFYASKLGVPPSGHGYRAAQMGAETLSAPPAPALMHQGVLPGGVSLKEMIAKMDRGVIIGGAMGAHSGNFPNGDYSVGLAPALYVERGEIVGLVKDAMAAGNVYEELREVVAVESAAHAVAEAPAGCRVPAVLVDGVSVTVG
jgi:PmbA protein